MTKKPLHLILLMALATSCNPADMLGNIKVNISQNQTKPEVSSVKVQNDQLIITGKNLDKVTVAKIEGSTNHEFQIESKTTDKLVLNAKSALTLLVGGAFDLIISNAEAAATFPISFELQNGQVTAAKLHHMGASAGQFLRFNGTNWAPSSVTTNQVYVGTYDANSDTPNLTGAVAAAGTYYIVTTAGTQNLGSGATNFDVGDWVISDGTNWSRVSVGTNTVSNFNGRTGAIVPLADDYTWDMLTKAGGKLTGSSISEIADVNLTGIQDGDVLIWNSTSSNWEAADIPAPTVAAGSITSTQIANSAVDSNKIVDGTIVNADISATAAIAQSKIANLTTDLGNKEPLLPTGGTALQYLRGNKTLATLDSAAVPENGNLYFTSARVLGTLITTYATGGTGAIAVTDTIPQALSKLETKTNGLGNYVLRDGTSAMTGDLQMGGNQITGLGAPGADADAATKKYVDDAVAAGGGGGSSQWTTNAPDIFYSTGNVGIGFNDPDKSLQIHGDGIQLTNATTGSGANDGTWINPNGNDLLITNREAGELRLGTSGSTWMTLDVSGNLGIGNPTPITKLDVNGDATIRGIINLKSDTANFVQISAPAGLGGNRTFVLPASYGSNDQVLTTDGSGNLSWTTPAGGGAPTGTAGGDLTGTYPNPTIAAGLDATKIGAGGVTSTEFGYLGGVTSDIQTQLTTLQSGKEASLPSGGGTGDYLRGDKTWHSLSTDVQASVITSFTPVTGSQVTIADTLLMALQRLQGQINTNTTSISSNWNRTVNDLSYSAGNVGINRSPAANTKLDVEGQIRSGSSSITSNAINFAAGNTVTTTHDCGTALTLANIRDGGSYTVVVTGTGTTQCTFSTTTTGDDNNTVTYRFQPANAARTASTHTIYSMLRVGTTVYVSWITGF